MMVCNESHVIARALRSVRETYRLLGDLRHGLDRLRRSRRSSTPSPVSPASLHRTDWVNFGHNRERALRLAQSKGDYVLILDADMVVHVHAPFKHKLSSDAYLIRYEGPLRLRIEPAGLKPRGVAVYRCHA